MWYCFGCGEGGDVINFVQRVDHLSFAETIEKLADKAGVQLRYVEGSAAINRQQGVRTRLVEAHKVAAAFYREQLQTPAAQVGREFLKSRGFDAASAEHFGVGYAPQSWDALRSHLKDKGFTDEEMLAGGLVSQGNRGVYDRFRGRLVWPIRDLGGDVIGFGARKLTDDDDGPKYLNTPETPIYKKSQVLYGIDLARKEISKNQQAVIVEGYTDVMACHLAGVTTAVATCGTSFGTDHIKVLRRLLMDDDQMKGQVVFTFDGDAAGQKAAMRAFAEDQKFVSQTFVAVESHGLDPCDLRLEHGDAAVNSLVENRVPLFEFAIKSTIAAYDLESAEGRIAALREAAPIVSKIRDSALRPEYARRLAGWIGIDVAQVTKAVGGSAPAAPTSTRAPRPGDPALVVEREALKCALQHPQVVAEWYASVETPAFTHPRAIRVHEAIVAAGGPQEGRDGLAWIDSVLEECPDDEVRSLIRELAVEPLPAMEGYDSRYAIGVIARLLEVDAGRRIEDLMGRLQRSEDPAEQERLGQDLQALQQYRRSLLKEAVGTT
jgi:DNA primase